MKQTDEYEIVMYPRLDHVRIRLVQIIYRNQHLHRELELGLVLNGEADIGVKNTSFPVKKGSIFFFNSNQPHMFAAHDRNGVKIVYIQIANNFCQNYLHLFRNLELMQNDLTNYVTPEQNRVLTDQLLQAVHDYMDNSDLYPLHCLCSICQLFSKIFQYVPYHQLDEATYLTRKKKAARLRSITEYIDSHYSDKISLTEIAQRENITVTYLSHFIRDNLNMTFQDYVNNIRFEKGLKLITDPGVRLIDVSLESGFSDVKYLTKMFEKRFGCTPKEYRKNMPIDEEQAFSLDYGKLPDQDQDFASEQTGRKWLEAFIKEN